MRRTAMRNTWMGFIGEPLLSAMLAEPQHCSPARIVSNRIHRGERKDQILTCLSTAECLILPMFEACDGIPGS
jgi:hypothetical protein